MNVKQARFIISNTDYKKCPQPNKSEYAFIGRSNVGKSSLINMLTANEKLAKVSGKPGKTQTINHFLINEDWYLVDLPGYGWASVPKSIRASFRKMIEEYILLRENLKCLFVLIDVRHEPQKVDLEFMEWLGSNGVPFSMIFTKGDKLSKTKAIANIEAYRAQMLEVWDELPAYFLTSSLAATGKEELLQYIHEINSMKTAI